MKKPLQPTNLQALFAKANQLHQSGQIAQAQAGYKALLKLAPHHHVALHYLGISYFQQGNPERGIEYVQKALKFRPDYLDAHYNLATALHGVNRLDEAIGHYKKVLAGDPRNADAHNNVGAALHAVGRHEEAVSHLRESLTVRPQFAKAHNNLGLVFKAMHRPEEAIAQFDLALQLNPRDIETYCNLGAILQETGRAHDSLDIYAKALGLAPGSPDAEAGAGNALSLLGRHYEALAAFDRALAARSDFPEALLGRAHVHSDLRRYDLAAADYEQALRFDRHLPYAEGHRLHAKMQCCDWATFPADRDRIVRAVEQGRDVATPWVFLTISSTSAVQHTCAKLFVKRKHPRSGIQLWSGERYNHDRIRVAYLSADMREHPMARLIVELLERHDKSRFETYGFSFGLDTGDALRARMSRTFDRFVDVRSRSDRDAADLVRDAEIDIAVDLMGFTRQMRASIFAMRPAPIQVNYLGYAGTMGADYMDYILADRFTVAADESHYSEKVVFLPHTYLPTDTTRPVEKPALSRQEAGLPAEGFVFCSFNANYKTTPDVFDIWMKLLREVEGSVLWLLKGNEEASSNLRLETKRRGVAPERLVFAPPVGVEAYLARLQLADLFLDTLPYNSHTTASDALWAGLPLLTCRGTAFAGRVASGILTAAGLPELVAESLQEYEARALQIARDPARLNELRDKLLQSHRMQPLFDTRRMTRNVEAAYSIMFQRHQLGEPPESFAVTEEPSAVSQ
jgi:protein O-GlcNAc transferase